MYHSYFIVFILLLTFTREVKGQPIKTAPAEVLEIKKNNKQLYFIKSSGSTYFRTSKKRIDSIKSRGEYLYPLLIDIQNVNAKHFTHFIIHKDTMSIKLIYNEYSPFQFVFEELHFKKGKYIIDLGSCFPEVKVYPLIVKNIFCECRQYIRKED